LALPAFLQSPQNSQYIFTRSFLACGKGCGLETRSEGGSVILLEWDLSNQILALFTHHTFQCQSKSVLHCSTGHRLVQHTRLMFLAVWEPPLYETYSVAIHTNFLVNTHSSNAMVFVALVSQTHWEPPGKEAWYSTASLQHHYSKLQFPAPTTWLQCLLWLENFRMQNLRDIAPVPVPPLWKSLAWIYYRSKGG